MASTSSTVHVDRGRIRFVPAPPTPTWMRAIEIGTWVLGLALVSAALADGSMNSLMWIGAIGIGAAALLSLPARIERRRRGVPAPGASVAVPPELVQEIRDLSALDRDVDAIRLVRDRLGVGLLDGKKIVDAACGEHAVPPA